MDIYLAPMGEKAAQFSAMLANKMRRSGVRTETDQCGRSLKAQLKYAGKRGVRFSVVIGDSELENNQATLRRMRDGAEEKVSLADLETDATALMASFSD